MQSNRQKSADSEKVDLWLLRVGIGGVLVSLVVMPFSFGLGFVLSMFFYGVWLWPTYNRIWPVDEAGNANQANAIIDIECTDSCCECHRLSQSRHCRSTVN